MLNIMLAAYWQKTLIKVRYQHEVNQITIVNVVCGDEHPSDFFTLVKSAIIFQNSAKLHFITLTEPNMQNKLEEQVIMTTWLLNMIWLGSPHN